MYSLPLRDTRLRVSLLFLACTLLVIGPLSATAQTKAAPNIVPIKAAPSPGVAAYAYVGTNVSGNGSGYVTQYIFGNSGVSLSTGSSASGASGYLAVTSQYVFATDGTNIVTYTRAPSAGLTQTATVNGTSHNITPQGSAVGPLTVDLTGHTLYAAEINYDGADDDAYTIWTINADGSLTYVSAIGVDVDYHSYLAFAPNNLHAYGEGCYFANWDLFGFTRNSDGTLTSLDPQAQIPPGNNNPMYCPGDLGVSAMNYVVVAYTDVSNPGSPYLLAVYTLNSDGTLGLVQNSEATTPFTAEHSLAFDPTGTYLAVAGDAGIQMYALQSGGMLAPVGSVVDSNATFNVVKWDDSGHLYAISGSGLYVFTSSTGALTQAPGSPMPITDAASLAVLPAQ